MSDRIAPENPCVMRRPGRPGPTARAPHVAARHPTSLLQDECDAPLATMGRPRRFEPRAARLALITIVAAVMVMPVGAKAGQAKASKPESPAKAPAQKTVVPTEPRYLRLPPKRIEPLLPSLRKAGRPNGRKGRKR